jgi:uncharacterized membrane protein YccC
MSSNEEAIRAWLGGSSLAALRRSAPIAFALAARAALAAAGAYAAARVLRPEPVWAPVSALIVLQGSVAGTTGAVVNRLIGTALGAAVAVGVAAGLTPLGAPMLLEIAAAAAVTALAVSPRPAARVATWTSVIVLMSTIAPGHPLVNAAYRVGEVAIGALVGGLVGALVAPVPIRSALEEALARTLAAMALSLRRTIGAPADQRSEAASAKAIEEQLRRCDALAAEARRERTAIAGGVDPVAASAALRELWHTVATLERAAESPVPAPEAIDLQRALDTGIESLARQLEGLGAAVVSHRRPPDPHDLDRFVADVSRAVGRMRRDGVLRSMNDSEAEGVYLRRFALEAAAINAGEVLSRTVDAVEDDE